MKLNIRDKKIESTRYIDITKEEIVELIYNAASIEPVAYILDKIGFNFISNFGVMFNFLVGRLVCRLNRPAREFFKIIVDEIKKEEEEIFYKIGDKFQCSRGIYRIEAVEDPVLGEIIEDMIVFVKLDGKYIDGTKIHRVKNYHHITQEEFELVTSGYQEAFTIIKEEEEEEEEVFYKTGDRFRMDAGIWGISIYQLYCPANNKVVLVKVEGNCSHPIGHIWGSEGRPVKDHRHITQEEFACIANGFQKAFTIIKEEEEEEEEEESTETFYKVGDRFNTTNGIHRLSVLGTNGAALVSEDYLICWASNYNVKDRFHITKEEFSRIAGNDPQFFTLFKF